MGARGENIGAVRGLVVVWGLSKPRSLLLGLWDLMVVLRSQLLEPDNGVRVSALLAQILIF